MPGSDPDASIYSLSGRKISAQSRFCNWLVGFRLAAFAVIMPVIHAVLGISIAYATGLSQGGALILGTLAASASYIAAPAAVRLTLPEANPGYYLTCSLAITFPFNIVLGLPLYGLMTRWFYG